MNAIADFFAMGGYAFYVWGSYLVTFACIGLEVVSLIRRRRALLQRRPRNRSAVAEGYV